MRLNPAPQLDRANIVGMRRVSHLDRANIVGKRRVPHLDRANIVGKARMHGQKRAHSRIAQVWCYINITFFTRFTYAAKQSHVLTDGFIC